MSPGGLPLHPDRLVGMEVFFAAGCAVADGTLRIRTVCARGRFRSARRICLLFQGVSVLQLFGTAVALPEVSGTTFVVSHP